LKKTENPGNPDLYQLEWSDYREWLAGVETYVVELLDEEGNVQERVDVGSALRYSKSERVTLRQVLYFRVKAISKDLIPLVSYSNVITYVQTMQVFLPDAFTPNEDGLNDQYGAKGLFVRDFRMQIFNRWGDLLFVSNTMDEGWDGTYQGVLSPPDTYVCKIEAFDFRGKRITKNKIFALIH
jgi:gliding motility-associated-like protein